MKQKQDLKSQIYESDKILDQTVQRMLKDPTISQANKANITAFLEDSKSAGITTTRLAICAASLKRLSRLTKADFQAFTQADAKTLMKALESSEYGAWTKVLDKTVFRQLLRSYKLPADVYDWIKIGEPPSQLKKEAPSPLKSQDQKSRTLALSFSLSAFFIRLSLFAAKPRFRPFDRLIRNLPKCAVSFSFASYS